MFSHKLSHKNRMLLNIRSNMNVQMSEKMAGYMKYHRNKFNELDVIVEKGIIITILKCEIYGA